MPNLILRASNFYQLNILIHGSSGLLRDGLIICNHLNIQFLIIELDASMIVNMFYNDNSFSRVLSPLIDDYRILLSRISHHKVEHYFREANRCANAMAKMELSNLWILFLLIIPLIVYWNRLGRMPWVLCTVGVALATPAPFSFV